MELATHVHDRATDSQSASSRSLISFSARFAESAPFLATLTATLLALLYGYEVFNFSLSIDEEVFAFNSGTWWLEDIARTRWGLGVLARLLPPLGSTPVLSTVGFCLGLGFAAYFLARMLFNSHAAQWTFAALFVASPLWPHLAQSNQVSFGIGVACVLLTISLVLIGQDGRLAVVMAALLLAVSIGIYQPFLLMFLVLLCVRIASFLLRSAPGLSSEARLRAEFVNGMLAVTGGVCIWLIVDQVVRAFLSLKVVYVDSWIKLDLLLTNAAYVSLIAQRVWDLITGRDPIYLGYGYLFTFLPLLGFLVVAYRLFSSRTQVLLKRLLPAISVVAGLLITIAPIVISAGLIPARALLPWIPLTAFLAGVAVSQLRRLEKPLLALLVANVFVAIWLCVSLFHTDHIARARDQVLATRLIERIDRVVPDPAPARIPFVIVGASRARDEGGFRRVEMFGDSFFEHGGGNPWRVAWYLRILGIDSLEPHPLAEMSAYSSEIDAMPVWPAAGSVAMIGGVLAIKLGPLQPWQMLGPSG